MPMSFRFGKEGRAFGGLAVLTYLSAYPISESWVKEPTFPPFFSQDFDVRQRYIDYMATAFLPQAFQHCWYEEDNAWRCRSYTKVSNGWVGSTLKINATHASAMQSFTFNNIWPRSWLDRGTSGVASFPEHSNVHPVLIIAQDCLDPATGQAILVATVTKL